MRLQPRSLAGVKQASAALVCLRSLPLRAAHSRSCSDPQDPYKLTTVHLAITKTMPGISDLLDTDMEDSTNFIDENSILSSASESGSHAPAPKKGRPPKGTKNRVEKPKAAPRKTKTSPQRAVKKPSKQPGGAKRKALAEHVNGQKSRPNSHHQPATNRMGDVSEDELESPKTLEEQRLEVAAKPKGSKAKRGTASKVTEQEEEVDQTPTVARSSHLQSGIRNDLPKFISKAPAVSRSKAVSRPVIPESQPEPMDAESEGQEHSEIVALPPARSHARTGSNNRQDSTFRRRAGSASDTERGGDPNLRRKLGDVTRKFENIDLKYRSLKEVGISEANTNMEKLRKQCEATTAASAELIASLKKELALQAPLAQESRKLQKTLANQQSETSQLRTNIAELSASLSSAQNEIKALQARLAASRGASVSVESANSKPPGSALRNNGQVRTIMVGSAEAAQAAQAAQLKEDLYSDLTGLIVRGVKRTDEGDTYDCIQTGRNGSKWPLPCYWQQISDISTALHFKLSVAQDGHAKSTSFEETEFLYTPLLDSNRDRDMIELLPDYLTEDITFSRQHAARFYSRVADTLTKRRVEE
jgi:hypothetical protein